MLIRHYNNLRTFSSGPIYEYDPFITWTGFSLSGFLMYPSSTLDTPLSPVYLEIGNWANYGITIITAISLMQNGFRPQKLATKETYSKWYFRSFSWLTCTIWLDVTRWRGSASDGISCCLGLRFKGWNFFGFLFWTTGLKPWEEVVDFNICLDDDDGRFLPLRVRLPLINCAAFLSFAVNVFEDAVWSWLSVSEWSAAAFLFGRRSLKMHFKIFTQCIYQC